MSAPNYPPFFSIFPGTRDLFLAWNRDIIPPHLIFYARGVITYSEAEGEEIALENVRVITELLGHLNKHIAHHQFTAPRALFLGRRALSSAAKIAETAQTQGLLSFSFALSVASGGCLVGAAVCELLERIFNRFNLTSWGSAASGGSLVFSFLLDCSDKIFLHLLPHTLS